MNVPVFVLSGFLGSGKTTLLLHLIQEAKKRGLQPGILMNELGKHDVDGHILNDFTPGITLEKLLDGCICCSKKSEVADCLTNLLRNNPDVIFIELTGVANPEEIADCLTEPQLLNKVMLKQIITILDAENVLEYNSIFSADKSLVHTLRRQIEVADLLVVNKTDLVHQSRFVKIEKAVRKQNPKAPLVYTIQSRVDNELIFAGLQPLEKKQQTFRPLQVLKIQVAGKRMKEQQHDHKGDVERSYSRVQTITLPFQPSRIISKELIERFLKNWDSKLLRAKGYLSLSGGGQTLLMQYAAKRMICEPTPYSGLQYVVFIGIDLEINRLTEEWNQITGQLPDLAGSYFH